MDPHALRRFHIKRIQSSEGISIWLVDGERVRKEVNENFVQSGHHARFSFIPTDEFWIDANTDSREYPFFIDRFFAEHILIRSGIKLAEAETLAADIERHEREEALSDKLRKLRNQRKALIEKIHRKPFAPYHSDQFGIWIVDGKIVRDLVFLEYDAGGHDRVYPWIPKDEIWIEQALSEKERPFILLHELHERFLMGEGKYYPEAHHGATIIEDRFRNNPKTLNDRIDEELKKNIDSIQKKTPTPGTGVGVHTS